MWNINKIFPYIHIIFITFTSHNLQGKRKQSIFNFFFVTVFCIKSVSSPVQQSEGFSCIGNQNDEVDQSLDETTGLLLWPYCWFVFWLKSVGCWSTLPLYQHQFLILWCSGCLPEFSRVHSVVLQLLWFDLCESLTYSQ